MGLRRDIVFSAFYIKGIQYYIYSARCFQRNERLDFCKLKYLFWNNNTLFHCFYIDYPHKIGGSARFKQICLLHLPCTNVELCVKVGSINSLWLILDLFSRMNCKWKRERSGLRDRWNLRLRPKRKQKMTKRQPNIIVIFTVGIYRTHLNSFSENVRPDAHQRGAFLNGNRIIVAHAPRTFFRGMIFRLNLFCNGRSNNITHI